jgi:iron complex outermembrane receptor protein
VAGILDPANAPGPNDSIFSLLTSRSTRQKQFSQEFQLQLTSDAFDLTAGLFYFHENTPATDILGIFQPVANGVVVDTSTAGVIPGLPVGPLPFDINGDGVVDAADSNPSLDSIFGSGITRTRAINDSYAAYGQLTYHLTDTIDLTGGLRYTIDKRENRIFAVSGGQGGQLGVGDYKVDYKKATCIDRLCRGRHIERHPLQARNADRLWQGIDRLCRGRHIERHPLQARNADRL